MTDNVQVDSRQSLENVESKWVSEIADNCAGVKLVLVALKCDLRENRHEEDGEQDPSSEKSYIDYDTGLAVAKRIQALRYLGTSHKFRSKASLMCVPRVLRKTKSWSQRGLHGSRSSRLICQRSQRLDWPEMRPYVMWIRHLR